jgi:hypothetical protein
MTEIQHRCGVDFDTEGNRICSVHKARLEESGAREIRSPGPSPHAFNATSWLCPVSQQQCFDMNFSA